MHEESSHKYIIYYLNVTRTRGSRDTISMQLDRRDLVAWQAALETTHFFKRTLGGQMSLLYRQLITR